MLCPEGTERRSEAVGFSLPHATGDQTEDVAAGAVAALPPVTAQLHTPLPNLAYLCAPPTDFLALFCVCDSTCDPVNLPLSQPKQSVFILRPPRHINI